MEFFVSNYVDCVEFFIFWFFEFEEIVKECEKILEDDEGII